MDKTTIRSMRAAYPSQEDKGTLTFSRNQQFNTIENVKNITLNPFTKQNPAMIAYIYRSAMCLYIKTGAIINIISRTNAH